MSVEDGRKCRQNTGKLIKGLYPITGLVFSSINPFLELQIETKYTEHSTGIDIYIHVSVCDTSRSTGLF
jgi:hypothetical protein